VFLFKLKSVYLVNSCLCVASKNDKI